MVKLKIEDKEYGLRMDMYAMEQIEDAFGSIDEMFRKADKGSVKAVSTLFRILANAALAYEGKEETVTGNELKRLRVAAIAGVGRAVRAAIDEGMKTETTDGEIASDDVYDVYLAEIESKK